MIPVDMTVADETLARYPKEPRHLISVLQDLQLEYRYLPREALEKTSEALGVPLSQVYGVATFYKAFSLTPKGETVLRVCTGTACHIRGAPLILNELETQLDIQPGGTTKDLDFSLEAVNCVGACALAPVVVANDTAHGNVTVTKARRLVKKKPKAEIEAKAPPEPKSEAKAKPATAPAKKKKKAPAKKKPAAKKKTAKKKPAARKKTAKKKPAARKKPAAKKTVAKKKRGGK
jgi:NADH-quinone oxidoreductase subunit E